MTVRDRIACLQAEGYNFEQQLRPGKTPFLNCVSISSRTIYGETFLVAAQIFGALGVNVNAIDEDGGNAFHATLFSLERFSEDGMEDISRFRDSVNLLISARVDLHHRNEWGDTPSCVAYDRSLWKEWCRAPKHSDVDIRDVLGAESYCTAEIDWSDESDGLDEGHGSAF